MTNYDDLKHPDIKFEDVSSERFREIILDLEVSKKKESEQRKFSESLVNGLKTLTSSESTDEIFLNLLDTLKEVLAFDVAIALKKMDDENYKTIISTLEEFRDTYWRQGKVFKRLLKGKPLILGSIDKSLEWEDKSSDQRSYASSVLYIPIIGEYNHVILCFLKRNSIFNNGHKELSAKLIPLVTSAVLNTEKSELIREKSKASEALFSSLPVGVITLKSMGKINPDYSKICEEIFSTSNISSSSISELFLDKSNLSEEKKSLVLSTVNSSIDEDEINFELNSDKLISEVEVIIEGQKKYLDFTWSYVTNDKHLVSSIILVIKDVTTLKNLEETEKIKSQELEVFSQLLSSNQDLLAPAIYDFKKMINALNQIHISKDEESYKSILRILHTMKGNARTYNLSFLSSMIHDIETKLSSNDIDLNEVYERSLLEIGDLFGMYLSKAKKLKIISNDQENSDSSMIPVKVNQKVIDIIEDKYSHLNNKMLKLDPDILCLIDCLRSARASLFKDILKMTIKSVNDIAIKLGKEIPEIRFNECNISIFNTYRSAISDVFGHLLRNSVDHGIEDTKTRISCGKNRHGAITVNFENQDNFMLIRYQDDGRGLNIGKIKDKAVKANLIQPSTDDPTIIGNLIFSPDFSSRDEVTITSGRGVGMDAVVSILKEIESEIKLVILSKLSVNGFCTFCFELKIPNYVYYTPIAT